MMKEAQADAERADYCGRIMAHAYVNEMKKIASEMDKEARSYHDVLHEMKKNKKPLSEKVMHAAHEGKEALKSIGAKIKKDKGTHAAAAGAGLATGAIGATAANELAHDGKKKKASALDEIAGELAVKIAADGGFDPEQAGELLDTLFASGELADSAKVAFASTSDEALQVRALELLEQVGYPVTWNV